MHIVERLAQGRQPLLPGRAEREPLSREASRQALGPEPLAHEVCRLTLDRWRLTLDPWRLAPDPGRLRSTLGR